MQSVLSKIWTRVAVSISYDDNHYTTRPLFLNELELICLYTELLLLAILETV